MPVFAKYHGSGNDFIVIEDLRLSFSIDPTYIQKLCQRRLGIGADGLILVQPSSRADFQMRIFNADGGEASMCGNGLRCLAHFLYRTYGKAHLQIELGGNLYPCTVEGSEVAVEMGPFSWLHREYALEEHQLWVVDTGVPHAVIFVPEVDKVNLDQIAPKIRSHFQPHGVNVNFASVRDDHICIRTYERGVEEEVLSCGSGAVAVAAVAKEVFELSPQITIMPASQKAIQIEVQQGETRMTGPATFVFGGIV